MRKFNFFMIKGAGMSKPFSLEGQFGRQIFRVKFEGNFCLCLDS